MSRLSVVILLVAAATLGLSCLKSEELATRGEWYASLQTHSHQPMAMGDGHEGHMADHSGRHWRLESTIDFPKSPEEMILAELTQYPNSVIPTHKQQERAEQFVKESLAGAKRNGWFDFDQALRDDYELMTADTEHYVKRDFVVDDKILDPDRPEFLVYYDTSQGRKLAAYMYMVRKPEERGPQRGGPLTVWHYHIWSEPACLFRGMFTVGFLNDSGMCDEGVMSQRTPEMLHVWFIDHPDGPFATGMALSDEQIRQLEKMKF